MATSDYWERERATNQCKRIAEKEALIAASRDGFPSGSPEWLAYLVRSREWIRDKPYRRAVSNEDEGLLLTFAQAMGGSEFKTLFTNEFTAHYLVCLDNLKKGKEKIRRWITRLEDNLPFERSHTSWWQRMPSVTSSSPPYIDYDDVIARWPRLCAHVICESLGYATPRVAAMVVWSAYQGMPAYCEWVDACYDYHANRPVEGAIRNRHHHTGYMSSYPHAIALVREYLKSGNQPSLASWF